MPDDLEVKEGALVADADQRALLMIEASLRWRLGEFETVEDRETARRLFGVDARADNRYRIFEW